MRKPIVFAAALLGAASLHAQQMDMAVAQKWAGAKVIKYKVEGVHSARTPVVFGDYEGKADVTDTLTLEFTWDVKQRKVVGAINVVEGKSAVKNLKSDGTNCPPPQLKGDYEHFQGTATTVMGDTLQVKGTRTYPAASVSNYPASCSMRAIPGGKEEKVVFVGMVTDPAVLAMPNMKGSPVAISADRKSFTLKGAENWVWTYTPTLVQ